MLVSKQCGQKERRDEDENASHGIRLSRVSRRVPGTFRMVALDLVCPGVCHWRGVRYPGSQEEAAGQTAEPWHSEQYRPGCPVNSIIQQASK